ncbi:tetratricopeptide repeat protein [Acetobacteraceae bacterium H6797]|nr:tetratricopeptide repeat protein [Acetobacteraceae bacterium H6797]
MPKPPPVSPSASAVLEKAVALHRAGHFAEAIRGYDILLPAKPRDGQLLYLRGHAAMLLGRTQEALDFLARSVAANPSATEAQTALGNVLLDLGRAREALPHFGKALVLQPANIEAALNRGVALAALGQHAEALAAYDKVIARAPELAEAHHNRGLMLEAIGRPRDAGAAYAEAVRLDPRFADAHLSLGNILHRAGAFDAAVERFEAVLQLQPRSLKAQFNRANALRDKGAAEEALEGYDRALAIDPTHAGARGNRAMTLVDLRRRDEALAQLAEAGTPELLNIKGNILHEMGRFEEALACFDQALALAPADATALSNRANALMALGRHEAAMESHDRALAARPDDADAAFGKACALISLGQFEEGWRLFEARKRKRDAVGHRSFPQPFWTGAEPVEGRTVFIHHEQGIGDALHLSRYAPLLAARGARVILATPAPLLPLLTQWSPAVDVIEEGTVPAEFDYHCPLMSLPLAFGTTLDTVPPPALLKADPERARRWAAILPDDLPGPRIGLVWSGNPSFRNDLFRSIPLAALLPLVEHPACWISLQKEIRASDVPALSGMEHVFQAGDGLTDFAETAAVIDGLDLVIAADSSVGHLAGSMGKPTWLMVPAGSDWRWMHGRETSRWYPQHRLFRQEKPGDWAGVVARVKEALAGL